METERWTFLMTVWCFRSKCFRVLQRYCTGLETVIEAPLAIGEFSNLGHSKSGPQVRLQHCTKTKCEWEAGFGIAGRVLKIDKHSLSAGRILISICCVVSNCYTPDSVMQSRITCTRLCGFNQCKCRYILGAWLMVTLAEAEQLV